MQGKGRLLLNVTAFFQGKMIPARLENPGLFIRGIPFAPDQGVFVLSTDSGIDKYAQHRGYTVQRPSILSIKRLNARLTLQELSGRSGIDPATLETLEWGKSKPNKDTIGKLSRALGCTALELGFDSSPFLVP